MICLQISQFLQMFFGFELKSEENLLPVYTCIYITFIIINDIGFDHSFTIGTIFQDTNLHLDDNGISCTNNLKSFCILFVIFTNGSLMETLVMLLTV